MSGVKGRRNRAKAAEWTDQIKWALENYADSNIQRGQALREIAKTVVGLAVAGEWRAIEEIGNRLEGKPKESIDLRSEIIHRVEELTDDELISIALGGSDGVAAQETGETIN